MMDGRMMSSDSSSRKRGSTDKLRSRVGRCRCSRTLRPASFSLAMLSLGFNLDREREKELRVGYVSVIWLLNLQVPELVHTTASIT